MARRSASASATSPIRRTSAACPTARSRCCEGLDVWIVDALRFTPHPSHFSVKQALELDRAAGAQARHPHAHDTRSRLRGAQARAAGRTSSRPTTAWWCTSSSVEARRPVIPALRKRGAGILSRTEFSIGFPLSALTRLAGMTLEGVEGAAQRNAHVASLYATLTGLPVKRKGVPVGRSQVSRHTLYDRRNGRPPTVPGVAFLSTRVSLFRPSLLTWSPRLRGSPETG